MLPPRHHHHRRRALWAYWPRHLITERGLSLLCAGLALVLIVIHLISPHATHSIRMVFFDRAANILSFVSAPVQRISQMIEHVTGLSDMASDLKAFREENARLRKWYDRARQLEAENRSLRILVNLSDLPRAYYATARVIAESGGAFSQGVIVDAGREEGVTEAMVAMTGQGVIGRVVAVGNHTAQITLLNDVNTRVPIMIENSRHRGILAGNNSDKPDLLYLPEDASVTKGDRILTSGHGGVFTAGLPVGTVSDITDQGIKIQPFADMRRLEYIQLIDFGQHDFLKSESFK